MQEKNAAKFALDDNASSSPARQTFAFRNALLEGVIWNVIPKFALKFAEREIAGWPVCLRTPKSVIRLALVEVV